MANIKEIENRKSYRAFSAKRLNEEQINNLFEAARLAASSGNAQGWKYYYAQKSSTAFQTILDSLAPANQVWAQNAPLLIVSTAAKFLSNGKPYIHAWHDVGMANAHMLLQAEHLGLFGHIMGGFSASQIQETLQISEDESPVCIIAIGYRGEIQQLSEALQQREMAPRSRKSLDEVAVKM